ncbi:MAG: HAD family hydrolase [Leptolyngbyaceae cyanobacterium SL_1_1]|nr:HAD family hydrolase [Leptolyngbyaceae cyanobacterium RM2_2_21]NJN03764.1 HAD family hydrolase [Leptolyngbyaceae cyanobacterium RM1_1_2]NJO08518.1 HAD family hydrolase [Leptolyngbyaceae cyanobacterium SL_1_1]
MSNFQPVLLAFDFDGVICDGLLEYFQTAWRAYQRLFPDAPAQPPTGLAEQFYPLRPVIETGWEMPVLLRVLIQGTTATQILSDWPTLARTTIAQAQIESDEAMSAVDSVRDDWIRSDLDNWLAQHRFYPGVLERLQRCLTADLVVVIISTKEGRFIQQLLQQQGVNFPGAKIFGKEVKQPKTQTLRQLAADFAVEQGIWFVEDRVQTLQKVQQAEDLSQVELFLADWGYNTEGDRALAQHDPRLHLLSLSQLVQEFSAW